MIAKSPSAKQMRNNQAMFDDYRSGFIRDTLPKQKQYKKKWFLILIV